ncbi:TIGR03620 family F420-dependent LLM class oxidoreductase [Nocardioides sp.]|uniref:TIGR03620 family F420-dependent LLM class oxidoreductase n=1 Tax=Nocardioides sp. TaxID=35761 RepID=UPI00271C039B|nr:TIGR03620 family F420-dependent LLM class oxidoreductase [Nocardioides sp.]MDO9457557.1 TIGR03620 family F420-dependent LLM class oxidoreductase [Nocardioides sp.]
MTTSSTAHPFGRLGAWVSRGLPDDVLARLGAELEQLGYGAIWISGGIETGVFDKVEKVLAGSERITVATGIVNIWLETPETVTDAWHRLEAQYPGRLYVGLGVSHAPAIDALTDHTYAKPLARTRWFLDELDAADDPLPPERRVLAALGPKNLALAAERSLGTHPYLVTPTNTAAARAGVGTALCAPELGVVLDDDVDRGRAVARKAIAMYFGLPNYTNNWKRSGFTDDDLADGGSDTLIDALVGIGDVDAIARRVAEHRDAGADHVCLQVLGDDTDLSATFAALATLA